MKNDWRKRKKRRKLAQGLGFDHYYKYKAEVKDQCIIYKCVNLLKQVIKRY